VEEGRKGTRPGSWGGFHNPERIEHQSYVENPCWKRVYGKNSAASPRKGVDFSSGGGKQGTSTVWGEGAGVGPKKKLEEE